MNIPEEKPDGETNTSRLNDPIYESAAALNAYLSGSGAASSFRPGRALPHQIIIPPERHTPNRTASLGTYIAVAVLFSIAVREGALVMRRAVFAETAVSQRGEPATLKTGEPTQRSALSKDKAAGKPAVLPVETKPWFETVNAFSQLFAEQRESKAEGWKPQVVAEAIPPSSEKPEPDSVP